MNNYLILIIKISTILCDGFILVNILSINNTILEWERFLIFGLTIILNILVFVMLK